MQNMNSKSFLFIERLNRYLILLILSTSLILSVSLKAEETLLVNPYTVPFIMPEGSEKFAGREVDLDRFRPAHIISSENDENLIFENYLHADTFWQARLSKNAVIERVYLHVVRFEVVSGITAAHVQLRAKLAPGSEIKLSNGDDEQYVDDIVISYEAARPKDESYNFFLGTEDNYLLAGRIASGEQRLSEYESSYTTEQYEVDLTDEERSRLVLDAVQLSHDDGLNKFYNSLKPNCVTKVFDLLDAILINRGEEMPEPFLTVISNDPVAGPTITGLERRGLLVKRFANLRDELEFGLSNPPLEEIQESETKLIPSIEGYPYSVVMMMPEDLMGSTELEKAKQVSYSLVPKFVQSFVSNLMLNDVGKSASLLNAFKKLSEEMRLGLLEVNDKLGDSESSFGLYIVPWDQEKGRKIDVLNELGVAARLPMSTFEAPMTFENLNEVHSGLNDSLRAQSETEANFGFMGVAIQFNLVKDKLSMSLQVVGHLGELTRELVVENDQVSIDQFVVPEQDFVRTQPIALLDLTQTIESETPDFKISFGAFGGLSQFAEKPQDDGKFIIRTSSGDLSRSFSVPSMRGSAASISLIDVWMDVFSLNFDLENQVVSDVDVRVSSGIFGFKSALFKRVESDPLVNAQFVDAVNNQIQDRISKVGSSPGLSLIETIFANNTNGVSSGFEAKKKTDL